MATGLPSGFSDQTVVTGLTNATAMQFAPDGRLFVTQQGGQVRIIKNGVLLPTPFLSLSVDQGGERGLLGLAFDPSFSSNRFVYVFYTATTPAIHNRISRFTANGDVVDTSVPEVVILDFDNLGGATNHNGGAMHFGLDGKLYAAHGENATGSNAQSLGNLLGKIIRMNAVPDAAAQVPSDNPFVATATGKNRLIWALGLRNPFTFSIQPGTGLMYVNDVGAGTWEEVNEARSGRNFGWPTTEGPFSSSTFPQFTNAIYAYAHATGTPTGCAITGGAFYNPPTPTFPASYIGKYFFSDFCSGWIYYLDPASPASVTRFAEQVSFNVDLKVGPDGALYYLARGTGSVGRIVAGNGAAPQITQHPTSGTVSQGTVAVFGVSATGAQPLSYQWQRNGVNISGAVSATLFTAPTTGADNNARYRCIVSNSLGSVTSNEAILTVLADRAPTATIVTPTAGTQYRAGTVLSFSGQGTDPEEGTLPPSRFVWRIDFHHDTHIHPGMPTTTGIAGGTFAIPSSGETSINVGYRVHLSVTDSRGLIGSTFVDLRPEIAQMTLSTVPPGLTVLLDGQPAVTPFSTHSVVGLVRTLGVATPQTVGDQAFHFLSWSDGGAASHPIATPNAASTYVATFVGPPGKPTGLRIPR